MQKKAGCDVLRDFPFYTDEMEHLNMNPELLARDIALGVGVAHWSVNIDITDV